MKTFLTRLTAAVLLSGALVSHLLAQSTWHLRHPLPTPHGLLGVTYANGLHVAVGFHNTILTSPDAVTWTRRTPESSASLTDVLYARGQFLTVGVRTESYSEPAAVFLTSTNGLDWTSREVRQAFIPNRIIEWRDLLVSDGHLLDEAEGRWLRVIATSRDGETWTERWRAVDSFTGPFDGGLQQFAVTESTIFASKPFEGGPLRFCSGIGSTNGVDWRAMPPDTCVWTHPQAAEVEFRSGIEFGYGSHQIHTVSRVIRSPVGWVVVGQPQNGQGGVNNFARIFTSSDGVHWTNRTEQVLSDGNSWFLSRDTTGLLARRKSFDPGGSWQIRSDDGSEWSRAVFDPAPWDPSERRDLTRATDGTNRVRIREETRGGTPEVPQRTVAMIVEHSLDGVAWRETFRREDGPGSLVVTHGNGQFLLTKSVTGPNSPWIVFTSPDGVNWTKRPEGSPWWFGEEDGTSGYLADLVVANGEFRLLAHSLTTAEFRLLSSATGETWTANHVGWNLGYEASLFATADGLFASGFNIRQSPWDLKLRALGRRADGALELQVSGILGQRIELQAATSLVAPDWQPVSTTSLSTSPMIHAIPNDGESAQRFYRALAK